MAGVMACLEYVGAPSHALHLPDIRPQTALPFVCELCAAAHRVVSQTDTPVDLLSPSFPARLVARISEIYRRVCDGEAAARVGCGTA